MPEKISGNSLNDELGNSFVTMTANFQRLSASEVIVVQGILKDLELDIVHKLEANPDMTDWRKSRYNALLAQTRDQIQATYGKITDHHQSFLAATAEAAGKATEGIFNGLGVPLQSTIITPEQWKALASRSLIEGAPSAAWWAKQSQSLQDAFVQQMRIGYASGESIQELVARVRGTPTGKKNKYIINGKEKVFVEFHGGIMDTGTRQAEALVRTSIAKIAADAQMETFRQNADIIKGVMWLATLDSRTTPLCFLGSEKFASLVPPEKIFRTYYEGEIIVVTTATGKQFRGTPNHPVLTADGWLPLYKLQPNKHVIYSVAEDALNIRKKQNVSVEATFAEFFDSVSQQAFPYVESTDRSAIDFYGDGKFTKGKVCIKTSDGFLRNGSDTVLAEQFIEDLLIGIHASGGFSREALLALLVGIRCPSFGGATFNTGLIEYLANKTLSSGNSTANIGKAHSALIEFNDSCSVPLFGSTILSTGNVFHNPCLDKQAGNGCCGSSVFPADLGGGYPISVFPDYVVSIRREFRREHVYTLQNCLGFYAVSGILVKNCRARDGLLYDLKGQPIGHEQSWLGGPPAHWNCRSTLVPVTKSFEELGSEPGITAEYLEALGPGTRASMNGEVPAALTFDKWFNTLPEADQKAFLGPKKWAIWKKAGLNFQDMVDQRGNPLTLEQLAHAYGFKIKQSIESGIPNIPKEIVSAIAVEQQAQILASKMAKQAAEAEAATAKTALEEMATNSDELTKQVYGAYADTVKDKSPQDALSFMQGQVELEKQAAGEIRDIKEDIDAVLDKKDVSLSDFNSAMEKRTALQQVDAALLPSQKLVVYESNLDQLKKSNAAVKKSLTAEKKENALLKGLEDDWKASLSSQGQKVPVWDMKLYKEQLDEYIAVQEAKALEKMAATSTDAVGQAVISKALQEAKKLVPQGLKGSAIKTAQEFEKLQYQLLAAEEKAALEMAEWKGKLGYKEAIDAVLAENPNMVLNSEIMGEAGKKFWKLAQESYKKMEDIATSGNALAKKAYAIVTKNPAQFDNWFTTSLQYEQVLAKLTAEAAEAGLAAIKEVAGLHKLDGSILKIGAKEFDLLDKKGMADFKKYKSMHLAEYKQDILAGKDPAQAHKVIYDNLSKAEKEAFDDSLALALAKNTEKAVAKKVEKAVEKKAPVSKATHSGLITDEIMERVRAARINGYAIPADKDKVEDQSILAWIEKDEQGQEFFGLRFKYTSAASKTIQSKIKDKTGLVFEKVDGTFYLSKIENGFATKTKTLLPNGEHIGKVYEATAPNGIRVRIWAGEKIAGRALENQIEILAPGASKKAAEEAMKLIQQELGIDVNIPTRAAQEEMYLRMIARHQGRWDLLDKADAMVRRKKTLEEIGDMLKSGLSEAGKDITKQAGYNPDGVHEAFDTGFRRWFLPGIDEDKEWKSFTKNYVLFHEVTNDDLVTGIDLILNSGGKMVPTANRLRYGIPVGGWSPEDDLESGGADYFFARIFSKRDEMAKECGLVFNSRQAARLDSICYAEDVFGRTTGNFIRENASHGIAGFKDCAESYNNEIIFKGGMSLFDGLEYINCEDVGEAKKVQKVLKKHGWGKVWIDGRPITDLIRVGGKKVL